MRWSYKNGGIAQFVGKLTLPALCSALLPKRTSTPEAEFESDQKWLLIIIVDPCKYSRAPAPFYCSACWCCGPAWPPIGWTRRWLTIIPSRQRTCPAQHGGSPLVLVIIKIAAGSAGNSLGLSVEVVCSCNRSSNLLQVLRLWFVRTPKPLPWPNLVSTVRWLLSHPVIISSIPV